MELNLRAVMECAKALQLKGWAFDFLYASIPSKEGIYVIIKAPW